MLPNMNCATTPTELLLTLILSCRPMKKKSVVAGIAQKGGGKDGSVGYGHAGDNGDVRPSPKTPNFSFSPANISLSVLRSATY